MGAFFHIKNRNMKGGPTMPETAARSQHETVGAIYRMPLSELHPHPLNPFAIRDDPSMLETLCEFCEAGECDWCIVNRLIDDAYNELPNKDRAEFDGESYDEG